jgi:hypothetical protein
MKNFFIYYSLSLFFYIIEIISFFYIYPFWSFDIFWLNAIIRLSLVLVFSIIIKKILFKATYNFFKKFFSLVIIIPLFASLFLKILFIFLGDNTNIVLLKLISDIASSLILYVVLRRIS